MPRPGTTRRTDPQACPLARRVARSRVSRVPVAAPLARPGIAVNLTSCGHSAAHYSSSGAGIRTDHGGSGLNNPSTDKIRNVAVLGHSGSGKTTLAEALLVRSGVLPRAGRVEDGSTVCDTEPEELKRTMSLSLAVAPFEWKASDGATYKVNLLDTPGYADFGGDVDAALSVADLAVLVISAVDGIEVGTESAWAKCAAAGLPRMVFVNKEDKPRADFHKVV